MVDNEKDLLVVGAGGHAKVVIAAAQAAGYRVAGLYDDDPEALGRKVLGISVLGSCREINPSEARSAVLAIGSNAARRQLAARLQHLRWATVIHPAAVVHPTARIGAGTVVFAGAVIQPDAELGAHVVINTGASVDHDCRVGDFVHIAPGTRLAGSVRVGDGALVGIGSCVAPSLTVGAWTVVGAGSAVTSDVPERVLAAGVPARVIKRLEDQ